MCYMTYVHQNNLTWTKYWPEVFTGATMYYIFFLTSEMDECIVVVVISK